MLGRELGQSRGALVRAAPLAPAALAFGAGIWTARAVDPGLWTALLLFALSFCAAAFALAGGRAAPAAVLPVFFMLGLWTMAQGLERNLPADHIARFVGGDGGPFDTVTEGEVLAVEPRRRSTTRLYVEARRLYGDGVERAVSGTVLLNVRGDVGLRPGDTVRFAASLRRPANLANPGGFDYEWWLARRGVFVKAYAPSPLLVERLSEGGASLRRLAYSIRSRMAALIDAAGLENAGVVKALVTGLRHDVPDEVTRAMARSGAAHLLAISGLHVGLVAFFFHRVALFLLTRSQRLMLALNVRKAAALLAVGPVLLYCAASGFARPAQRAAVMAAALIGGYLLDRGHALYNAVALAALVILLVSPGALWDASFHLSFAAVIAIVYLLPRLKALIEDSGASSPSRRPLSRRLLGEGTALFLVSLAASAGTWPLTARHFNTVPLIGPLVNMAAVPLVGFAALPAGLAGAVAGLFSESLGAALLGAADLAVAAVVRLAGFASELPLAYLTVTTPTTVEIACFYGAVVCLVELRRAGWAPPLLAACVAVLAAFQAALYCANAADRELRVTFMSVGQGESALVEFPGGVRMVVDAGGGFGPGYDAGERIVAPFLWHRRISAVDYAVLSHPQADHGSGLPFIVRSFGVKRLLHGGGPLCCGLDEALAGTPAVVEPRGAWTGPLEINGVVLRFFNPPSPDPAGGDVNDRSLVMKLTYGRRSILFTGDISSDVERRLVAEAGPALRSDVLKAAHHGSGGSSSAAFIEAVSPGYAVVSAGRDNRFGFPHAETLRRFAAAGVEVLRTDRDGAVTVITDGERLEVRSCLTDRCL
ncbi:MAG TPA: DNA internalization-related competence protein ComEC/Rec2 [Deltaproteobacteria bacterium]|nr:DNA internalization-related competence protein ComEC/Rec2 [Deltaproteobacteria bacterium]